MATQFFHRRTDDVSSEKKKVEAAGAGATTEAIGAVAAVALSIIGLAGAIPAAMMSIATIVLGGAILMDAASIGARRERLAEQAWGDEWRTVRAELGAGLSAESFAGLAGIALGILALLGLATTVLCSVALIVFGAGLIVGSGVKNRFASLSTARYGISDTTRHAISEAMGFTAGSDVLVGLGAVTLGIIALTGTASVTLVLVGYLGVGAAVLLGGSAFAARMFSILRHSR